MISTRLALPLSSYGSDFDRRVTRLHLFMKFDSNQLQIVEILSNILALLPVIVAVHYPNMKDVWYNLIVILPPFILLTPVILIVLFRRTWTCVKELKDFAINAFSGIIKAKTTVKIDTSKAANNSEGIQSIHGINLYEETRWLLKDIDITDRRNEIFTSLLWLFVSISSGCAIIFWSFLLLDVSFSCDDDDNSKDCFEYKLWNLKILGRDPIDCNSAAVQNGTVQVVCYKIVFNFGLAAGASYGTFKFTMIVLNVATTLMLKVSKRQTVCILRVISGLLFVGVNAAFIAIQASSLRVRFIQGNLVIIFQMIVILLSTIIFLFVIPWKEIVTSTDTTYIMANPQGGSSTT